MEFYAAHLRVVSAVHSAGAHKAAMKLFGDEHLNIYELVKWACSCPPPASATLYSEVLWMSVDVLSIRLDDNEKKMFCEVTVNLDYAHLKAYLAYANCFCNACCAYPLPVVFAGLS